MWREIYGRNLANVDIETIGDVPLHASGTFQTLPGVGLVSGSGSAALSISAIAFECGFCDLSYFNRTFRRAYNATPSDIRDAALRARQGFLRGLARSGGID